MAATAQAGKAAQEFDSPAGHNWQYCRENLNNRRIIWTARELMCITWCCGRMMYAHGGELLTDKELERMKLHNPKRDWPRTAKAKVYAESCYISFGVRFGRVKQYLNTGK